MHAIRRLLLLVQLHEVEHFAFQVKRFELQFVAVHINHAVVMAVV